MKKILLAIAAFVLVGGGAFLALQAFVAHEAKPPAAPPPSAPAAAVVVPVVAPTPPAPAPPVPVAAPATEKTLAFTKPREWRRMGAVKGAVRANYHLDPAEGDAQGPTVQVRFLGAKTFEDEIAYFCKSYETADGRRLTADDAKIGTLDAGGLAARTLEI